MRMPFICAFYEQSIILRSEMIPYTAQMDIVTYGTGKWTEPFADKSGAYIFLPNGPAKVSFFVVKFIKKHIFIVVSVRVVAVVVVVVVVVVVANFDHCSAL